MPRDSLSQLEESTNFHSQVSHIPLSWDTYLRGLRQGYDSLGKPYWGQFLSVYVLFQQIPCPVPRWRVGESRLEEQIGQVITRLELPPDWRSRIEELVNAREETSNIEQEQARLQEKLGRLKSLYLEVLIGEEEFRQGKAEVEVALANLKPPSAARIEVTADQLKIMRMAWQDATKEERSEILSTLFEAVYCDPVQKRLLALKPKLAFVPLFREIEILEGNGEKFEIRCD